MFGILIACSLAAIDLLCKKMVKSRMNLYESKTIVAEKIYLKRILNTGLAFSTIKQHPYLAKLLSGGALALLFGTYCIEYKKMPGFWRVAFGFMLGGGLGNVIDRLINGGVTDYLYVQTKKRRKMPIFNLADLFIAIGAGLACVSIVFQKHNS